MLAVMRISLVFLAAMTASCTTGSSNATTPGSTSTTKAASDEVVESRPAGKPPAGVEFPGAVGLCPDVEGAEPSGRGDGDRTPADVSDCPRPRGFRGDGLGMPDKPLGPPPIAPLPEWDLAAVREFACAYACAVPGATANLLAWYVIEDDRPLRNHSALVLIEHVSDDKWTLVQMYRHATNKWWNVAYSFHSPAEPITHYKERPTSQEIDDFLDLNEWEFEGSGNWKILAGNVLDSVWERLWAPSRPVTSRPESSADRPRAVVVAIESGHSSWCPVAAASYFSGSRRASTITTPHCCRVSVAGLPCPVTLPHALPGSMSTRLVYGSPRLCDGVHNGCIAATSGCPRGQQRALTRAGNGPSSASGRPWLDRRATGAGAPSACRSRASTTASAGRSAAFARASPPRGQRPRPSR